MKADFGGYATRNDLLCADGRTITRDAFKHQDKVKLPLVWDHKPKDKDNILGHVILENREDGVYVHGSFNSTAEGQRAKELVRHGDIEALSIWANELVEQGKRVTHGMIREVSLVWAGANPGALIDNVYIQHSDGSSDTIDGEAIIYTGYTIQHGLLDGEMLEDDDEDEEETVLDVWNTLTTKQKNLFDAMLGNLMEDMEPEDQGTELVMNHYDDDSGDTFDIVDAYLMLHYGVKGMQWGKRKKRENSPFDMGGKKKSNSGGQSGGGSGDKKELPPYKFNFLPKDAPVGSFQFMPGINGGDPIAVRMGPNGKWEHKEEGGSMDFSVVKDGEEYNIDPRMTKDVPYGTVRLKRTGAKGEAVPVIKYPDGSWKTPQQFKKFQDLQDASDKKVKDSFRVQNAKGAVKNFNREAKNNVGKAADGAKSWVKDQLKKVVVSPPTQSRSGMVNPKTGKMEYSEWKTNSK